MRVSAIYVAPVKSLALVRAEHVHVLATGIVEDRCFFLVSDRDRLFTQRECGPLAQVRATYTLEPETLRLDFPDGSVAEGTPGAGEALTARFFGQRDVEAHAVAGPWSEALSNFAGVPVRLARPLHPGDAYDALPVSLCSIASVAELERHAGGAAVDERRFRQNFMIEGSAAHDEDRWIGSDIRIGMASLHVVMPDSRCEVTTHDPNSGVRDLDTLRIITSYRTDQTKEANFGVYATVLAEGEVAVGDTVAAADVT